MLNTQKTCLILSEFNLAAINVYEGDKNTAPFCPLSSYYILIVCVFQGFQVRGTIRDHDLPDDRQGSPEICDSLRHLHHGFLSM
jgi:hypothetical protein